MYTKECVFLLSTFGEEMFISTWLLPLQDRKDTVITQNRVRRRKVSLYIYQRSAEVEWKWDRVLLYFAACSPPGPDPAKPFAICFDLSFSLEFTPMQEGVYQGNVPNQWSGDGELIIHLIRVCYNAGSLFAVPGTRFLPCTQLRPSCSATVPRLQKDDCWSELQPHVSTGMRVWITEFCLVYF